MKERQTNILLTYCDAFEMLVPLQYAQASGVMF